MATPPPPWPPRPTPTPTYSISGTISGTGGTGATVTLSGTANGTTTADGSGNYSFGGLGNGSYTITPSNSGVTFTPPSQTVTVNGASVSGVNFTTPPPTPKTHLSFALGPTELVYNTVRIISAEWTATPNWKPSLKAKVSGTLANNTATASWTLPESPPAGADHRVAVELSFRCEVSGVIDDGIPPNPVLVDVGQGKDLKVSWLAISSLDPNTGMVVVSAGVTSIG